MFIKSKYLVMGVFALVGAAIGLAKVPRNRKKACLASCSTSET
jgi:hypothetical protein